MKSWLLVGLSLLCHSVLAFQTIDDSVYFTYDNYEAAMHTLVEGAILAIIVVSVLPGVIEIWRSRRAGARA